MTFAGRRQTTRRRSPATASSRPLPETCGSRTPRPTGPSSGLHEPPPRPPSPSATPPTSDVSCSSIWTSPSGSLTGRILPDGAVQFLGSTSDGLTFRKVCEAAISPRDQLSEVRIRMLRNETWRTFSGDLTPCTWRAITPFGYCLSISSSKTVSLTGLPLIHV